MDGLAFAIFLIILVVVAIGLWWVWKKRSYGDPKPCSGTEGPLVLPLYKGEGGLYKTQIHLGAVPTSTVSSTPTSTSTALSSTTSSALSGVPVELVPDIGSNVLVVSGDRCTGCDATSGLVPSTLGTDISGGFTQQVSYGGGQTTNYRPHRGLLLDYGPGKEKEVDFGIITQNSSYLDKPENVLGLQPGPGSFFSHLCGPRKLLFDFPKQRLVIGDIASYLPASSSRSTFTLYRPPQGLQFILGHITSAIVNGQSIPERLRPTQALFDTGTANTFVSPDLYDFLTSSPPTGRQADGPRKGPADGSLSGPPTEITLTFDNRPAKPMNWRRKLDTTLADITSADITSMWSSISNFVKTSLSSGPTQGESSLGSSPLGPSPAVTFPLTSLVSSTHLPAKTLLIGSDWLATSAIVFDYDTQEITLFR